MAKKLGGKVEAHTTTYGVTDADEDCEVGDAVAIVNGDAAPFDGDNIDSGVVGVRARGDMSGDVAPVTTHGPIVAKVADGLTAGTAVGGGNTTDGTVGILAAGGSRGVLLCDEGGEYKGASIAEGAAVVDLR